MGEEIGRELFCCVFCCVFCCGGAGLEVGEWRGGLGEWKNGERAMSVLFCVLTLLEGSCD